VANSQLDLKQADPTELFFARIVASRRALSSSRRPKYRRFRVGPAVFLTNPSELFCQYGLDIKARSPFKTFPVELANGDVGYVPTEEALGPHGGGYETRMTSREIGAGRKMVEAALELAAELKPGRSCRLRSPRRHSVPTGEHRSTSVVLWQRAAATDLRGLLNSRSPPGRDQRQDDVRGAPAVVIDGVVGPGHPAMAVQRLAGVGIDVEAGEVAAGDVQADAVAFPEDVRCRVELDGELVGFPGLIIMLVRTLRTA
jgi:hypothetical protein